jgi:hypothetical protein
MFASKSGKPVGVAGLILGFAVLVGAVLFQTPIAWAAFVVPPEIEQPGTQPD